SGIEPRAWMAVTVGLHVANGLLVAAIALASAQPRPDARAVAAAAGGAALFLFFAPGVEVAAWVSGRFDAVATLFSLLSVLAFVMSRRRFDFGWWASLAAMAAACLSKESAAVVPFAIVLYARFVRTPWDTGTSLVRWSAALRVAAPWLALALLYLAARWAMFGSATAVYQNSSPLASILSPAYWQGVADAGPDFLRAQFRPTRRYPLLVGLTVLQLALVLAAGPADARARGALHAPALTALAAVALLLPHISQLPPTGLGGRLLYQAAAFYGIFVAVALRHTRLQLPLWGVTGALVLLHALFHADAVRRWEIAQSQMRALVEEIRRVGASTAPGDFTLVMVPLSMQDVPFAGNAQMGLMVPPVMPRGTSARLLVQAYEEIPEIPAKIRDGVIPGLQQFEVAEYLAGKRAAPGPLVYPSRIVCWDAAKRLLRQLPAPAAPEPEAWARGLREAIAASPCAPLRS
ncbi:MAG TPA: hypothetical protein VM122_13830, partial [Usitatibacter sp.]|nr:hypothetical protein [Usitatibacter sp.]